VAANDLIFSRPPLPAGAVNLVFGDEEVTIYEATLSGILPGLSFSGYAVQPNDATLSATLPGLTFSGYAVQPNDATLTTSLPGLTFAAEGLVLTGVVYEAELTATLPGLTFSAYGVEPNDGTFVATMPGLTFAASVSFDSNVSRPTVGYGETSSQQAASLHVGVQESTQGINQLPAGVNDSARPAVHLQVSGDTRSQDAQRLRQSTATGSQDAVAAHTSSRTSSQEMLRDRRPSLMTRSQDAVAVRTSSRTSSQDRYRDRRPSVSTSTSRAVPLRRSLWASHQKANPLAVRRFSRSQDAMRPPAGIYEPPVVPPINPCYTPDPNLVFWDTTHGPHLLFICDNHVDPPSGTVVVPVRKVYFVLNNVTLKRVADNLVLPAQALSLSLDVDSWTWGFNASLPGLALDDVMPGVGGEPIELEANVNGTAFRLLAENVSRDRAFGSNAVKVSGRGKSALLAAPYAPVMGFGNASVRTAQQLMNEVLSVNGVPIGWGIDWQIADWTVPGGAFSLRGTYIEGLNAIAGAAGAYLQPHPTLQEMRVLARYPVAPWDWGTVTPDFELPAAVTTREGIEWRNKPAYNRVFVSGQGQGILGQITRAGTPGDLAAGMVTDPLITHVEAARQRGLAILGDTGRQAQVTISLPVLAETGVIAPGKFVRYVDGAVTRLGLVRSTSVSTGKQVRQSLVLETHE